MTDTWTIGYDYTGADYPHAPAGPVVAGYVTGSGGVPWTQAMWDAHPDAVRIDQSPVNTPADETADALDFENGAATLATLVPWCRAALANFKAGTRPGQRRPLIYASASNLTTIANALTVAGLINGEVGFWVAHWGVGQAAAVAAVEGASGNWPIHAYQYANGSVADIDVFSDTWLNDRSVAPAPPPPPPPPKATAVSLTAHYSDGTSKEIPL